ncbi:Murein DD-endopeptidase MepM and murein hydrolase activator NlpD, contain LysM domain [Pseudidiomarina donghaiensis]|nr:Murein DD-endopeptidase MepM and murein hydrolase activator NlpD, contain LysM domain [Pseudidiomarina donghaiensis]
MLNQVIRMFGVLTVAMASFTLAAAPVSSEAPTITLTGAHVSGGLLIGELEHAAAVELNGNPLPITDSGHVVFGFGRDVSGPQSLVITGRNGQTLTQVIDIKPRKYNIDRVDGVPQKTVTPDPEQQARARKEAAKVWAARNNANSQRADFLAPIKMPAAGRISGVYGSQRIFNGTPRNPHFGLDIAAPTGTPVFAPWAGKVVLAENDLFYSGGTLIIEHGYGVTTTYIHLHKLHVQVGDEIQQGDRIAEIGATGRVTGPHLDWRINWRHERLDPALAIEFFSEAATNPVPAADR